ncbi:MAG TPA: dipeptidase [Prolixibacteraceae bacterium]|nr:dipeptidase [Prolixibacteraceae bacterium]
MDKLESYLSLNGDRFLEELFGLIRIPSVSSLEKHKPDMLRAAEYWKMILLQAGADNASIFETPGHPVVYAEKIIDLSKPTILVYAHMDVMPVDPIDKWHSDPFEPVIKDGKIWARGADDDKGQSFIHAKAFEWLVKSGTLNCNVKFMIEGEEEVGSTNLGKFCEDHKEMLKADVILVSDTGMIARDIPSITSGLRGLAYWEVEVTGPNRDLHSGLFGGAVANPVNELCKLIARMTDSHNRITIPGFYDDVVEVSDSERKKLSQNPFDEIKYKEALQIEELQGEEGYTTTERTGIRPTFDVCGIWGGYTGEGSKTILPSKAYAKISARLVPDQDHQKIALLFKNYFESIAPKSVRVNVKIHHGGQGYLCPIDHPAYLAAEKAFYSVYGKMPVPVRSGGSIPIVSTFEKVLGVKTILMGFGLESDAIHSPNENFLLENFFNGIRCVVQFYHFFSRQV